MTPHDYLQAINKRYQAGISREHSYRADLESLIRALVPNIDITNEPANVTDCGNPDYVITRGEIPVGYIEAKDVGKDLHSKQYQEQFRRYQKALDNLIITDYLQFQFFQEGQLNREIRLGQIDQGTINPLPENFTEFQLRLQDFCTFIGQTIHSPQKLAEMMAAKARLLQTILENALTADEAHTPSDQASANTALQEQYQTFKKILIHDLTPAAFADIYAQTLAYGMFAARLHDTTLDTFSRQEAAELIPQSNPFLRKLFQHVAGYDIDPRIRPTVDNLAEVFRATNVEDLLHNFGSSTQQRDPVIHFYETFLAEYDPQLRKSRGVWYTPEPVVNFIVRAVDDLLKREFGLPLGLADTSKTTIRLKTQTPDKRSKSGYKEIEQEIHKVQILDPATGTGTFLAEIIRQIYQQQFMSMRGAWSSYVANDLIPRLNGFELLMASYAMAHLKLDMLLRETGYTPPPGQRFHIYLTNSLEEHHPDTGSLFASWLSAEASEANRIKRDTPVMVVLGNPPYAVSSSNASIGPDGTKTWIGSLLDDYKKDLNEKKINLDDDYIKFIRYGQYLIDKNGEGILAYISNNSFIDGITHRQMRTSLMNTFTDIYILNLHGSSMRYEQSPDGTKDENVFDIRQGVTISILIKKLNQDKRKIKPSIYYYDLWGVRKSKYNTLHELEISKIDWVELIPEKPWWFLVPKKKKNLEEFKSFLSVTSVFQVFGNGIGTDRDALFYDFDKDVLSKRIKAFYSPDGLTPPFSEVYRVKNSSSYPLLSRRDATNFSYSYLTACLYRPFDTRILYYNPNLISRPGYAVMQHLQKFNTALLVTRQISTDQFRHVFVSNMINDRDPLSLATRERTQIFPLYLYPETDNQKNFIDSARQPNLNMAIVTEIADKLGLRFTPEKETTPGTFAPLDLLDYIYAVLHSPTYRETYKEFLKIDFPRVPYPTEPATFWQLVGLGGQLRQIHLLESPLVNQFLTSYPIEGDNRVTRRLTKSSPGFKMTDREQQVGQVWINDQQYFAGVPVTAWEFYIGGYQPAQKWLKDRRGRVLSFDDLRHYQKIIVALTETARLMTEIDEL